MGIYVFGHDIMPLVAGLFAIAVLSIAAELLLDSHRQNLEAKRGQAAADAARGKAKLRPLARLRHDAMHALDSTGIHLTVTEFTTIWVACTVVPLLVMLIIGMGTAMALVAGVCGFAAPLIYAMGARRRNRRRFEEDLGQVLPLVASNLRAGLTPRQAMGSVAENLDEPIRGEFRLLNADIDRGVPLAEAIEAMAERTDSHDLVLLSAAVRAQSTTGGNLAEVVDSVGETIRARVDMRRMVRSRTAQGRATAVIMVLVPPILGLFLAFSNDMYMEFFLSPMGLIDIIACALFEIAGYAICMKMCDIKAD